MRVGSGRLRDIEGMDLKGSDEVVGMLLIRRDANVLTVTEDALGERIPGGEFPLQKRGGMGTIVNPAALIERVRDVSVASLDSSFAAKPFERWQEPEGVGGVRAWAGRDQ